MIENEIQERAIQSIVLIQREKRQQKEVLKNIKCVSKLSSVLRMKNGGKLFSKARHSLGQEQPREHQKLAKRARSALGRASRLKKQ